MALEPVHDLAAGTRMHRRAGAFRRALLLTVLATAPTLAAVPLHSLPRLIRLQDALGTLDPASLVVSVLADERMARSAETGPSFHVSIQPVNPGAFLPVDEQLPMQVQAQARPAAALPLAPPHTRWTVYVLAPEARQRLQAIQTRFRAVQGHGSAKVTLSVAQQALARRNPALAGSHLETWLQYSAQEGPFPIWLGTLRQVLTDQPEP